MKREKRNKENQIHTCIDCKRDSTMAVLEQVKNRRGGDTWICKDCYKKMCRGE